MCAATVVSIGTFDGVHRGHQALMTTARRAAGAEGRVVVLCFDPHPLVTLRPEAAPARLSGFEQRRAWLSEAGADEVRRLEPTRSLLSLTGEQFIDELCSELEPAAFVEGPDFRFGRGRAGDVELLRELGGSRGFDVHVHEPVTSTLTNQAIVRASSTLLRWLIRNGRVRDAAAVCDRPFELVGVVEQGDRRGRDLGVPTANVRCAADQLLPADGIYAGQGVRPDGTAYSAAVSIGTKPTFGNLERACEAHLIGFDGSLEEYGWSLRIQFADWLRDQIRYDNTDSLIEQIRRDCQAVVTIVGDRPSVTATAATHA